MSTQYLATSIAAAGQRRIERPRPDPDAASEGFWEACRRHELVAQHCAECGAYSYPPGITCRVCQSQELAFERVSGRALLYSFALLRQPFHAGFADELPLVLAMVQLVEDERAILVTNIVDVDVDALHLGMELEVTFDDRPDVTVPLFRPAVPAGTGAIAAGRKS